MQTEWFIVRHKSTDAYMPEMGRGYTYWEPVATEDKPRLFRSKRGAQQAIAARGEHYRKDHQSFDWGGYDEWSSVEVKPETQRVAADLEVRAVKLTMGAPV